LTLHQDIVRSLSSGLVTTDPQGTVLTVNAAAAEMLGVAPAAFDGAAIEALLPGVSALLPTDPQAEVRRADLTVKAGAGELTLGVSVSPLRDVREQVIGRVINFQDLTELKRLEQHMRRAERLATVGQLAAGVAHEIRNPLASISGSIELLRQAPQVSEDDRSLMTIVTREIDRLNALITDLLDYANPRPPQVVEFDLVVLVDETLQVARQDRALADIALTVTAPARLPIAADPAQLRQVLWNLVRNAADAAAAGGRHVGVTIRDEPAVAGVAIEVTDDGPGIPAEQVARIFDPFFTTKRRGTGLGLATCHALVADHAGRIDVDSAPGRGTTMIVRLPARPASGGTVAG
jgi:two-component system sensor histidine kinase PilS (NtrC family)